MEFGSKIEVKQLELVQRNTAKSVTNQPYNPHNPSSVTEMINHLKWPSLQQGRAWADVTIMNKVIMQEMCCVFWLNRERWYCKSALPITGAG